MNKSKFVEFNDGVLRIYSVNEGDKLEPKIDNVRYGEEITGITRHYNAKSVGEEIAKTIHIPIHEQINTHDIVVIGANQFDINQVQNDKTTRPYISKLSLVRLTGRGVRKFVNE